MAAGVCFVSAGMGFTQDAAPPPEPTPAPGVLPPEAVPAPPAPDPSIVPLAPAPAGAQMPENPEDFEFLSRGPVHEAFAEQYNANPEPGLIVAKQPPEPVDEVPPDVRPEGDNVVWVPGYWAWDDERDDFIYVSGTWRVAPPGQRWVPGYWTEGRTEAGAPGWQWVSGFWTGVGNNNLSYLPTPPQSLDYGPVGAAPTDSHFWRPGVWQYANNGYQWSPGYWSQGYDNYCWIPDRYVWTPQGCLYAPGYWDGLFSTRGFLYTPVFIPPRYFYRPYAFRYRPRFVVGFGNFGLHLFVRPWYRHYYYGDYFAGHYGPRFGIHFWSDNYLRRRNYDPNLAFHARYHRRFNNVDYIGRVDSWNRYYQTHADRRPPQTIRAQEQFLLAHRGDANARTSIVARDFNDAVKDLRSDRIVRLTPNDVQREQQFGRELREIGKLRSSIETSRLGDRAGTDAGGKSRLPLLTGPGSNSGGRSGATNNPPEAAGNLAERLQGRGKADLGRSDSSSSGKEIARSTGDLKLKLPETSRFTGRSGRESGNATLPSGPGASRGDNAASNLGKGDAASRVRAGAGEVPFGRPKPSLSLGDGAATRSGDASRGATPRSLPAPGSQAGSNNSSNNASGSRGTERNPVLGGNSNLGRSLNSTTPPGDAGRGSNSVLGNSASGGSSRSIVRQPETSTRSSAPVIRGQSEPLRTPSNSSGSLFRNGNSGGAERSVVPQGRSSGSSTFGGSNSGGANSGSSLRSLPSFDSGRGAVRSSTPSFDSSRIVPRSSGSSSGRSSYGITGGSSPSRSSSLPSFSGSSSRGGSSQSFSNRSGGGGSSSRSFSAPSRGSSSSGLGGGGGSSRSSGRSGRR